MKLEATIVVSLQARSLGEAGAALDEILRAAREREDVDVQAVELRTPTGSGPVTLPHVDAPAPPPAHVPHPVPGA
ncbi:MAG TPA: hypothetical protein VLA98_00560 [Solirubrobacteraceae bacterium]|nr:hypothetical protein [Solirubrobacteraceae bacterium]